MARPERHDCDYFPFICKDGRTLSILENKYQCTGTGFFTNVMRFLTMQTDHHICIKEESDKLYFFARVKCEETIGVDMLNLMAKTGKIDPGLWITHQVVVSPDLLNSLKAAYERRTNQIVTIAQIRLLYPTNPPTTELLHTETHKQLDNCALKGDNNPQTKLNYTKLKAASGVSGYNNPVDDFSPPANSKEKEAPLKNQEKQEEKSELQAAVNEIVVRFPRFPLNTFLGNHTNGHQQAIIHVLKSLLVNGDGVDKLKMLAWCEAAYRIEEGKYNARDTEHEHEVRKRPVKGELESFGNIMRRIAAKGGENERSP